MTHTLKMLTFILICILMWVLIITLCGCVSIHAVKPDGAEIYYYRIGNQELGNVLMESDGSFLIEKQHSENEALYEAVNKLVDKIP